MSHTAGDWTDEITLPTLSDVTCPACGVIPFNAHGVMSCLMEEGEEEGQ